MLLNRDDDGSRNRQGLSRGWRPRSRLLPSCTGDNNDDNGDKKKRRNNDNDNNNNDNNHGATPTSKNASTLSSSFRRTCSSSSSSSATSPSPSASFSSSYFDSHFPFTSTFARTSSVPAGSTALDGPPRIHGSDRRKMRANAMCPLSLSLPSLFSFRPSIEHLSWLTLPRVFTHAPSIVLSLPLSTLGDHIATFARGVAPRNTLPPPARMPHLSPAARNRFEDRASPRDPSSPFLVRSSSVPPPVVRSFARSLGRSLARTFARSFAPVSAFVSSRRWIRRRGRRRCSPTNLLVAAAQPGGPPFYNGALLLS